MKPMIDKNVISLYDMASMGFYQRKGNCFKLGNVDTLRFIVIEAMPTIFENINIEIVYILFQKRTWNQETFVSNIVSYCNSYDTCLIRCAMLARHNTVQNHCSSLITSLVKAGFMLLSTKNPYIM